MEIEERRDLGRLVTFVPNKKVPIHNWFYFKEGFSREFVLLMLNEFGACMDQKVLDPFCGVGTTLLVAKEKGLDSVGVDASPLAVFVSQTKTMDYDLEKLRKIAFTLFSKRFEPVSLSSFSSLVKKAFPKPALEDIVFFKEEIRKIDDPLAKNFFTLALMNAANKVTYAVKDGSVIKIVKKPVPPLKKIFKRVVKRMIKDLERFPTTNSKVEVYLGDARKMDFLPEEEFDLVITSPPYLNKIEYTKVYRIEYELFFGEVQPDLIRSYLGLQPKSVKDPFPELNLPDVAKAYFQDLADALSELYRVCKKGAKIALVVAEGVFPDRIVPADLLTAKLAERSGFTVDKILVANRRVATKERTIKIGRARESVLLIHKPS